MKKIIFLSLVLFSPCLPMQPNSLKKLNSNFSENPSKETIIPLQQETETIIKKYPDTKAKLSYQLSCCWWQLWKNGDQEAESRYNQLLKQAAAAATKDKELKAKISRLLAGNECQS